MTYLVTIYGLEDDTFIQEVCSDVDGVEDLSKRLRDIINHYETLRGSGYKVVSVVLSN